MIGDRRENQKDSFRPRGKKPAIFLLVNFASRPQTGNIRYGIGNVRLVILSDSLYWSRRKL